MRPFRLLGDAQLALIGREAARIAAEWHADWVGGAVPATSPALRTSPAAPASPAARAAPQLRPAAAPALGGPWVSVRSGGAACFIERRPLAAETLLFGAVAGEQPSALAREAADAALADLARRWLKAPADVAAGAEAPSAEAWHKASGAVVVQMDCGGGTSLALLLDGPLTARWLATRPRSALAAAPLQALPQAIGVTPLRLAASVGDAVIDVATLQTLAIGDVVVLDLPVDRPLRLSIAGGPARHGAYLGSHHGRRALQLTAAPDFSTNRSP
jgi:hypothetical protein